MIQRGKNQKSWRPKKKKSLTQTQTHKYTHNSFLLFFFLPKQLQPKVVKKDWKKFAPLHPQKKENKNRKRKTKSQPQFQTKKKTKTKAFAVLFNFWILQKF